MRIELPRPDVLRIVDEGGWRDLWPHEQVLL